MAGREPRRHHRGLGWVDQHIALADRRVDRVGDSPGAAVFLLLPRRAGHGAIALAGDGQGEFLAEAEPLAHLRDDVHPHLLRDMIEIAVAALIDALSHVDLAVAAPLPAVAGAGDDAPAAAA